MRRRWWKRFTFTIPNKFQQWLRRNWWWVTICLTVFVIAAIAFVKDDWVPKTGFKGKTVWEWLELLGVPITLAVIGLIFQQQEQKRSRDEAKDEILDAYFDRLSVLLVDKNVLAIAVKLYPNDEGDEDSQQVSEVSPEEQKLFDAAIDIIRARTLSILRRFKGDGERKASVIKFLVEAEVVSKAKLHFSGFDLREAQLSWVNLTRANLNGVNLTRAELTNAELGNTSFYDADLTGANLSRANLNSANLSGADLTGANLSSANLKGIYCHRTFFSGADLSHANLSGAIFNSTVFLERANLEFITWSTETVWPDKKEVAKARNIPETLKQELGIESSAEPRGKETK